MPRNPVPDTLLRRQVTAVTRRLREAEAGDTRGIHRARVATRRLREGLRLLAAGTRRRKLERTVRRLTRALGPVRELDVSLALLRELESAGLGTRAALDRVRTVLGTERRQALAAASRQIARWDAAQLIQRARAAGRARDDRGEARTRQAPGRTAARRRAARRAGCLRDAMARAAGLYVPDRLHDVRIAVKKLRYALELVRQLAPAGRRAAAGGRSTRALGGQLTLLKETQDLLGRMHDLEVLAVRIRDVQCAARVPDLRLSAELDELVRWLEAECRRLHGHYMTRRPQLLEVCGRVIAAAARERRRAA